MAKGYLYYVTTEKTRNVCFNAAVYLDNVNVLGAEYLEDCDENESEEPLKWLADFLGGMGAVIDRDDTGIFRFSFRFYNMESVQQDYFRPKLEKLKETVEKLTLSDVVQHTPELDSVLNDRYGDMIRLEDGRSDSFVTMDDFIRQLKSGVTCYVYKETILMG